MLSTFSTLLTRSRQSRWARTWSSLPAVSFNAGQPTAETHPELLEQQEVQPGITKDELRERRRRFAEHGDLLGHGGVGWSGEWDL